MVTAPRPGSPLPPVEPNSARQEFLTRMRAVGVGDDIICDGEYTPVLALRTYPPGTAPGHAPIFRDAIAHEIVTARGSRWWGERLHELPAS